jgi:hypothetical protein
MPNFKLLRFISYLYAFRGLRGPTEILFLGPAQCVIYNTVNISLQAVAIAFCIGIGQTGK